MYESVLHTTEHVKGLAGLPESFHSGAAETLENSFIFPPIGRADGIGRNRRLLFGKALHRHQRFDRSVCGHVLESGPKVAGQDLGHGQPCFAEVLGGIALDRLARYVHRAGVVAQLYQGAPEALQPSPALRVARRSCVGAAKPLHRLLRRAET